MTPYRIIQILQTYSIEHWGRGIEKICELGADIPFYELRGNDLRVHFKASHSALVSHPISPNRHNVGLDVGLDG